MVAEPTCWLPIAVEAAASQEPPSSVLTVYRLALAEFEHLESVLLKRVSAAEQAQAGRYLRPADRARFLVGRAGLRVLLGRLLRCAPSAVPLETNAFGKPQLPAPAAVQFNVTHSGAWVVIALGAQPVGIDAEKIEPGFDYEAVLAHSFGAAEQAAIRQSAHPQAAFYAHWTQHEARAKAAGHGLLGRRTSDQAAEWTVLSLDVAPGYAAALAYPSSWRPVLQYRTCDVGLIG